MELKIFSGRELMDSGLAEELLEFDRRNMRPIFEKSGLEFPEEKRRKGLQSDPTFIIAFDGQAIAGYLEYLRSWTNPDYIYVGSVQIAERYRGARLILMLFDQFRALMTGEEFLGFETNVQKANTAVVRMYQKIGFRLEENPRNDASWVARAGKEILTESPVAKLIDRWRERSARRRRPARRSRSAPGNRSAGPSVAPNGPAASHPTPYLTRSAFEALLDAEVATLSTDVRSSYEQYRVEPVRMEHRWKFDGREVSAPLWVIAQAGPTVLAYDEVEEEWGIGLITGVVIEGGVVDDWGTFGDRLQWTLLRFP